jgi:hypothetical protein
MYVQKGGFKMRGNLSRLTHDRRHYVFGTALVTVLAALLGPSLAMATPKGEFAVFADCPLTTASTCLYAKTESGKFIVGKETVPIEKAITLQGGLNANEKGELTFVAAADGNTLSKTPQKVPGGLAGLVKCNEISNFLERLACEVVFENGVTGVNATSELAAPASSIGVNLANYLFQSGTALSLPLKVHLENPFLGSSCYIGSNSSPIIVNLTTGTTAPPPPNTSITGSPGTEEGKGENEILAFSKNSLVNNSFAAPGANGCGGLFAFLIDPIVNSKLGLPSAAGKNTAVLNGIEELASSEAVKKHE